MADPSFSVEQILRLVPPDQEIEVIVKYNGDIARAGERLGATVEILSDNYAVVTLYPAQIPTLYGLNEVEYIELPKELTFQLSQSLVLSCITDVQRPTGFGLSGAGVIVGIIDSGIDFTHPDFGREDGTSRVLFLWDQSLAGEPPAGFKSGSEYNCARINLALGSGAPLEDLPSIDYVGHGTAVAGIAAGNGRASRGMQMGVAPQADLIVVKLRNAGRENFPTTTEVMRGIKYIIDKARELNKPCAINISYGTNNGSHTGNSLFEGYINEMADQWKTVICVATGNEGAAGHHFRATLKNNARLIVEFAIAENIPELYLTLWKNFADTMTFELISPDNHTTGLLTPTDTFTERRWNDMTVLVLYGQPTHYTSLQEVFFTLRGSEQVSPGVWRIVATGENIVNGTFDIWLPTVEQVTYDTYFLQPELYLTMTLPSTASRVIAVGGYQANTRIFSNFSGRGDSSAWAAQPDLVAPAESVITSAPGGGYSSFSGTSMAAPFVTGSAALMMEWGIIRGNDPFLYGQRVKAFLRRGATRDEFVSYPNAMWGYGQLCLFETMHELVQYNQ